MLLGQVQLVPYQNFHPGCTYPALGRRHMGQALRCWETQDGGTVCSDLKYHPPGCPSSPAVTESEVLSTPPEAATAACGGGGITVSPGMIPAVPSAPRDTQAAAPSAPRDTPSAVPSVPTGTPAPAAPARSGGIPTWGYAVGGVAVLGLVGWLIFRK